MATYFAEWRNQSLTSSMGWQSSKNQADSWWPQARSGIRGAGTSDCRVWGMAENRLTVNLYQEHIDPRSSSHPAYPGDFSLLLFPCSGPAGTVEGNRRSCTSRQIKWKFILWALGASQFLFPCKALQILAARLGPPGRRLEVSSQWKLTQDKRFTNALVKPSVSFIDPMVRPTNGHRELLLSFSGPHY